MGKFLDGDIVHQGMFTPEELDVLNFVTKTATERLGITTQEKVERIASTALFFYATGMTDPDLLLQEILSRFGKSSQTSSPVVHVSPAIHLDNREQMSAKRR